MKVLVTGRSGAGKTSLARELTVRGYNAYDGDTVPNLAYWHNNATGQNLGKDFPADYDVTAYSWNWDGYVLRTLLDSGETVILCGSSNNAPEFYNLFDKIFILDVEPAEQIRRMAERGDEGYGGSNVAIQKRVVSEQAALIAEAASIGAIVIDANMPVAEVATKIVEVMYAN